MATDEVGAEGQAAPVAEPAPALTRFVQGFLDHLSVERGMSPHTVQAYRRDLARYLTHLAGRGVTDPSSIDAAAVSGFAHVLQSGGVLSPGSTPIPPLARASVARAVVAVRSLHRFGVEERITLDDPATSVQPPSGGRRLPKALPLDQVQALLDGVDRTTPLGLRDAALLELLYGTGARITEVVSLDVDDLSRLIGPGADPRQGLRLLGKGDKERIVPLGSYARRAVSDWLVRGRPTLAARGSDSNGALLLNSRGGRLSRQSGWGILRSAAERAQIGADVSPHTLRHSFATHLLDGGADVRVVQELLGHASVTTTQIYTMVTVDHLREVYLGAHPRAR